MSNLINIKDALNLDNTVFIDVRSPAEFEEASIPGAINIPILENDERANVGTVYRRESQEKALGLGIDYASKKLLQIYTTISQYHQQSKNIIIFCWRGGLRSKSVCSFLSSFKLHRVYQLIGGYKAYRKYVVYYLENRSNNFTYVVLHGLTGVGKTHILVKLKGLGEPVLDLEGLAKNSGSVFGNILFYNKPPSQKEFESEIFNVLYRLKRKIIFVESESKRIGNVHIPDILYKSMIGGHHILIDTHIENRIEVISNDYIYANKDDKLIQAIFYFKKKLGNEMVDLMIKKIQAKDYEYVIRRLIELYYDPLYQYSIQKNNQYDLKLYYEKIDEIIPKLIEYGNKIENNDKGSYKNES